MGITTSYEKRVEIYRLAKKYNVLSLEDNPYGELRFSGEDIPTIKSFDDAGIVVYCGSFSKILSAGMRVGFLSAPEAVFQKIVVAKQVEDVHTNQFFQMLCADFIEKYGLDEHIASVSELYRSKCELMLGELDKNMPKCVKYTRPEGGLFVWLTLPDKICLNDFVKKALEKKVAVVPGTAFSPEESEISHSFRITYSTPSREQIVRGVKILADIIKEMV
jgi:2-aminoadipate transaminase